MIEERLARLINNEKRTSYTGYSPDTVKTLARALGNPQDSIRTVHIAGTNGKGSVAHMLDEIFRRSGYRTGLYTSPHLLRINERIRVNGVDINDTDMARFIDEIENVTVGASAPAPTWFDVLTLMALLCFRDRNVDIAIMETGLGGRLDSTNIIRPLCSVITDISHDHTGILGTDIADIASEKAGIIKKGVPLITSNSIEPVAGILKSRADSEGAESRFIDRDFQTERVRENKGGFMFDFMSNRLGREQVIKDIAIPLTMPVQVKNAALALETLLIIRGEMQGLDDLSVRQGFLNVRIPGRMEILSGYPMIIFDPAHNPAAIESLLKAMERYRDRNITIVFTLMKDKDVDGIMEFMTGTGFNLVYFEIDEERAWRIERRHRASVSGIAGNMEDLCKLLRGGDYENSFFIFTGSSRLYRTALAFSETENNS